MIRLELMRLQSYRAGKILPHSGLVRQALLMSGLVAGCQTIQGSSTASVSTATPVLHDAPVQVAQIAPPQFIPTDITPFSVSPGRNAFSPGYKFRLFQVLPERFWFDATTEVSQRLDTNVFFTYSQPRADYAFRVLPNVTLGYNFLKNTSVYANYFVIKDTFADHTILNFPTTQSLSWGIQHNKQFAVILNWIFL